MELIFFYLFASLAVAAALGVVFFRNPISSAFSLVFCFFCLAAVYALLQAHFLAIIQILVYAGAIMVLFIFVIMLLNLQGSELVEKKYSTFTYTLSLLVVIALGGILFKVFSSLGGPFPLVDEQFGGIHSLARLLFTNYWLIFETISVLLIVALVGGVVLAKRKIS